MLSFESPREWKLPGKLWFALKHSRVYRGKCKPSVKMDLKGGRVLTSFVIEYL